MTIKINDNVTVDVEDWLIAQRVRVSDNYVNVIGTESHERNIFIKIIEHLMEERKPKPNDVEKYQKLLDELKLRTKDLPAMYKEVDSESDAIRGWYMTNFTYKQFIRNQKRIEEILSEINQPITEEEAGNIFERNVEVGSFNRMDKETFIRLMTQKGMNNNV